LKVPVTVTLTESPVCPLFMSTVRTLIVKSPT
jgi:hypothetical protein